LETKRRGIPKHYFLPPTLSSPSCASIICLLSPTSGPKPIKSMRSGQFRSETRASPVSPISRGPRSLWRRSSRHSLRQVKTAFGGGTSVTVHLVCRRCRLAFPRHSRPWFDVICTACGQKFEVWEHRQPPEGYRDHRGQVIRYPRYSPIPPRPAYESPPSFVGPQEVQSRPQDRPAWLAGLPDPPRTPHATYAGRDRRGRYLPKPWFPGEVKPPERRWMPGARRTPTHVLKCQHCGTMFSGFLNQKWCSRRCRSRAFYHRNKSYWVERRRRKSWSSVKKQRECRSST
jgi:hypothetical protein